MTSGVGTRSRHGGIVLLSIRAFKATRTRPSAGNPVMLAFRTFGRASTPGSLSSWGRQGQTDLDQAIEIEAGEGRVNTARCKAHGFPRKEFLGADSNKMAKRSATLPGPETVTRRTGRVKTCTSFEPRISILAWEIVVILSPGKIWRCLWAMRSHFRSGLLS